MTEHTSDPQIITFTRIFLDELIEHAGFQLKAEVRFDRGALLINFVGEDVEPLFLRRGFIHRELIEAFQDIVQQAVHNRHPNVVRSVSIDANNYRENRADDLQEAAARLARKLADPSCPIQHVEIYGMGSIDRRAMHHHLSNNGMATKSDGYGVLRRLLVRAQASA